MIFTSPDGGLSGTIEGPAGAQVKVYTNDPSTTNAAYIRGVGLIASRTETEGLVYYHYDAHGNVVQRTSGGNTLAKDYYYDAFGVEQNADPADTNPFRYCGEQYDRETGDYYLRARYYTPGTGRFGQEDTHWNSSNMVYGDNPLGLHTYTKPDIIAIGQAGNLYVYGMNNPVRYIDPTGQRSKEEADKIIKENVQNIKNAAEKLGVNPAILAASIYAEQRLNVGWDDDLFDGIGGFYGIDTSIGVAQVRVSTAKNLEDLGYMPKISRKDGGWDIFGIWFVHGTETMARAKALEDPAINIMYAAADLAYIQDIWREAYPEIDGRTAIMATLYNRGEYGERGPHANPQSNSFGDFAKENYYYMQELLGLN